MDVLLFSNKRTKLPDKDNLLIGHNKLMKDVLTAVETLVERDDITWIGIHHLIREDKAGFTVVFCNTRSQKFLLDKHEGESVTWHELLMNWPSGGDTFPSYGGSDGKIKNFDIGDTFTKEEIVDYCRCLENIVAVYYGKIGKEFVPHNFAGEFEFILDTTAEDVFETITGRETAEEKVVEELLGLIASYGKDEIIQTMTEFSGHINSIVDFLDYLQDNNPQLAKQLRSEYTNFKSKKQKRTKE